MTVELELEVGGEVVLSYPEFRHAAYLGVDRFVRTLSKGQQPRNGPTDCYAHVVGAWGEVVVAKSMGTYWTGDLGRPDRGAPDVGPWHVRTTLQADGPQRIYDYDADADPFLFVTAVRVPRFRIVGWCYAHEGKHADFLHESGNGWRPAYHVPRSVLRPFDLEVVP